MIQEVSRLINDDRRQERWGVAIARPSTGDTVGLSLSAESDRIVKDQQEGGIAVKDGWRYLSAEMSLHLPHWYPLDSGCALMPCCRQVQLDQPARKLLREWVRADVGDHTMLVMLHERLTQMLEDEQHRVTWVGIVKTDRNGRPTDVSVRPIRDPAAIHDGLRIEQKEIPGGDHLGYTWIATGYGPNRDLLLQALTELAATRQGSA